MKHTLTYILSLLLVFTACVETEPVSPIPQIEYESFDVGVFWEPLLEQYQVGGELVFDFIDGDADFGLYTSSIRISDDDSLDWNKDNYNVFLTPFYKEDSLYYPIETDTTKNPPPWYVIKHDTRFDRVGQNKTIKGSISIVIIDLPQDYDTIRYEFYIQDRSGNESNVEVTADVGTHVEIEDPEL